MWRMWLLNTVVFHSRGVTLNDLLKATERCASIFNEAKLEKIGALNLSMQSQRIQILKRYTKLKVRSNRWKWPYKATESYRAT